MGVLLAAVTACAPKSVQYPVFKPLSYRSDLPRVTAYPDFAMPGAEVVLVARPLVATEVCLRVIDRDAFVWHETCWEGGDYRRIPFHATRTGTHTAYLAYAAGDGWATDASHRDTFCVVGEDAGCP